MAVTGHADVERGLVAVLPPQIPPATYEDFSRVEGSLQRTCMGRHNIYLSYWIYLHFLVHERNAELTQGKAQSRELNREWGPRREGKLHLGMGRGEREGQAGVKCEVVGESHVLTGV